jgi:prepilin-type processing-associated H-X9-DG protein
MFKVIGKDGQEYGPVSADGIRLWISEGRLDSRCQASPETTTEWKALGDLPEFKEALAAKIPPSPGVSGVEPQRKTSGLAIASLVLGVLGMFTFGLTAIVGLVLGIIALIQISRNQTRLSGLGLAIAGTCVSGFMVLMLPVMAAMLLPALARAKQRAQSINCMNNIKQINLALVMYATDHKDTLPPTNQWCDLIKPYIGGSSTMMHCPAEPPGRCSYALNANIANKKLSELRPSPAVTILVFSAADGWNTSGGPSAVVSHHHDDRFVNIGFADGHTESVKKERVSSLSW